MRAGDTVEGAASELDSFGVDVLGAEAGHD